MSEEPKNEAALEKAALAILGGFHKAGMCFQELAERACQGNPDGEKLEAELMNVYMEAIDYAMAMGRALQIGPDVDRVYNEFLSEQRPVPVEYEGNPPDSPL